MGNTSSTTATSSETPTPSASAQATPRFNRPAQSFIPMAFMPTANLFSYSAMKRPDFIRHSYAPTSLQRIKRMCRQPAPEARLLASEGIHDFPEDGTLEDQGEL